MPFERASVLEGFQLGVEADVSHGVAVPANKQMRSVELTMKPQGNIQVYGASGSKFDVATVLGEEWAVGDFQGYATYTEILYFLSSVIKAATITSVGTTGKLHTFAPSLSNADSPKTYTIEVGNPDTRADRYTYGAITALELGFSRKAVSLSGQFLAQAMQEGIAITASPSKIALEAIFPRTLDFIVGDTIAELATNPPITRGFDAKFKIGNRWGALYPVGSANSSFAALVELKPVIELALMVERDSAGMQYLSNLRNGTTKYVRVKAIGGQFEVGPPAKNFEFYVDMAAKLKQHVDPSKSDGVEMGTWTWTAIDDGTNQPVTVKAQNTLAGL